MMKEAKSNNLVASDARSRPKPFTFRPPGRNGAVIALIKFFLPLLLRKIPKVTQIDINDEGLVRLESLKGKRCILTPSHSGGYEPYLIMHLSKLLRQDYNYLAAMEAFERSPLVGWILQRLGVYSIIRGTADRLSFQMTRKLIAEGRRWLVIFPEGQTCWQNDTVMPFQEGVTQLAFKACEEVVKKEDDPLLYFVPITIKYIYINDMHGEIDDSLRRLEGQLFHSSIDGMPSRYDRLRRIGEALLSANEKKYGLKPHSGDDLDSRIQAMKEFIISRTEAALNMSPRPGDTLLDRIRAAFNAVDRIVHVEPQGADYERKLLEENQQKARQLYDDLWRTLEFVAIYDGYVKETFTVERFMDVLFLLEMEVFGRRELWGPRKAVVRIGEPLNLKDYFEKYGEDKRGAVGEVTALLESGIKGTFEAMAGMAAPLRDR
ncbi:MAG: 1-acyl-sn-glycerol-3-phosphate acyltransferase [Deltaproteobacteria bacterium]|nr:1-acyl-sn-glycerol-3-phosphate acyltransferase [Deltaproteobacteria bacterium]